MNAIAPTGSAGKAVVLPPVVTGEFSNLPASIRKAIVRLDLSYPIGTTNLSTGEMAIRYEAYGEAIEGFLTVVVMGALKDLVLNNPRNHFAPTPMDVNKRCKSFNHAWLHAVAKYMVNGDEWLSPHWATDCPAPGTPGHPVPLEHNRKLLKESPWWRDVYQFEAGPGYGGSESKFARIRPEAFEPSERERVINNRKVAFERQRTADEKERRAAAERHKAWLIECERREKEKASQEAEVRAQRERVIAEVAKMSKEDYGNKAGMAARGMSNGKPSGLRVSGGGSTVPFRWAMPPARRSRQREEAT